MKFARVDLVWIALYALLVTGIVWGMLAVRDSTLQELDSPLAQSEWQSWREATAKQAGKDASGAESPVEGPVQRRMPTVDEPPTLVLMRDHFRLMLGAALLFSSVLFGFLVIVIRGLIRQGSKP